MTSFQRQRELMVERQIAARGVRDARVLEALRKVPREAFLPQRLVEFAYEDVPLPIDEGQTISQPYIVAVMTEALGLEADEKVLEVGCGSGYAAAILSMVAGEVFTIERHRALAESARERLQRLGYDNVRVLHGDGTRGWAEHAPYDAIVVAAGGPEAPQSLLEQLAIGGRLVIPVGKDVREQELVRIVRRGENRYERSSLGRVRFVPLVGAEGWALDGLPPSAAAPTVAPTPLRSEEAWLSQSIAAACEPFDDLDELDLSPLLERIGERRVVLLGEATHGTSEFYRLRARITRELIERRGFTDVAIEGDWPDVHALDCYARHLPAPGLTTPPFSRFPTWMWRNHETLDFLRWLRGHNLDSRRDRPVQMRGLDLYGLYNSIGLVLDYLDRVDPEAAAVARTRYACLGPWQRDPAAYGRAVLSARAASCEDRVVEPLAELLRRRLEYMERDGESFFDARMNARVVRDAERYYRIMYRGSTESWNLRDRHMFETLLAVEAHRGAGAGIVVWAHNSHVGDARATEMHTRGELNIGELARRHYGDGVYSLGFGTDRGTVAAASDWGDELQRMTVRPAHANSYERLCRDTGLAGFLLPLGQEHAPKELRLGLAEARLERAIGVIYRPATEMLSHYFEARLPLQFDEYAWIDETTAVDPVSPVPAEVLATSGLPETYPFGL